VLQLHKHPEIRAPHIAVLGEKLNCRLSSIYAILIIKNCNRLLLGAAIVDFALQPIGGTPFLQTDQLKH